MKHKGRKSGQHYETPIMAFRTTDGFAIALTYGSGVDWVRNVLAAGYCELEYRGRTYSLDHPHLRKLSEVSQSFPRIMNSILGFTKTTDALLLTDRSE